MIQVSALVLVLASVLQLIYCAPMNSNEQENLMNKHDSIIRKLDEFNKKLAFDYLGERESLRSISPSELCASSSSSKECQKTGPQSTERLLPDLKGDRMLLRAVESGRVDDARRAIQDFGAEINMQDSQGVTAFLCSVIKWRYKLAEMLLRLGADPNLPDMNGRCALHYAAHLKQVEILRLLLQQPSINVNQVDIESYTPLAMAIQDNRDGVANEIIQMLLDTGKINLTYRDKHRETYLGLATIMGSYDAAKLTLSAASPDTREFLFMAKDVFGYSALGYAIAKNRKDLVLLFLCNGAKRENVKAYSKNGKHQINREIVQILVNPKLTDQDCLDHKISSDSFMPRHRQIDVQK